MIDLIALAGQHGARRIDRLTHPRPAVPARSGRLAHREAEQILHAAGIKMVSSGGCGDRDRSECTSLEGIRWLVIEGLLAFKQHSGCPIVVTGGTEAGHADGRYNHARGYKLDRTADSCVSGHTMRHARYAGTCSDGADTYRTSDGAVYYCADHWDILFRH